jgi:Protein kinase domain
MSICNFTYYLIVDVTLATTGNTLNSPKSAASSFVNQNQNTTLVPTSDDNGPAPIDVMGDRTENRPDETLLSASAEGEKGRGEGRNADNTRNESLSVAGTTGTVEENASRNSAARSVSFVAKVTGLAKNDPESLVPLEMILDFEADQAKKTIKYDGQDVWNVGTRFGGLQTLPAGYLVYELDELATGEGKASKLNLEILEKMIEGSGGDWDYARYVADVTHLTRPKATKRSEMYFQQHVYPPVSGILGCFRSAYHAANQLASSGFFCRSFTPSAKEKSEGQVRTGAAPFKCMPDAACLACEQKFVLGTMELKSDFVSDMDNDDLFNCVLLTSITAVAMVGASVTQTVFVPFVIGMGEAAYLYVTTYAKTMSKPETKQLYLADLHNLQDRVQLVSRLALLLHKLTILLKTWEGSLLIGMLNQNRRLSTPKPSSGGRKNSDSSKSGRTNPNLSKKLKPDHPAGQQSLGAGIHGARDVAACEGLVSTLVPFREGGRESPYYFLGTLAPATSEPSSSPVFIKVWREGDDRTSLRNVESEIQLLSQAHRAGVPCPAVITELTCLSITFRDDVYHRLVMHRLANHAVERPDIKAYAISLISAVHRLHEAGILHCDVKPSNVVWDATAKAASLVDFGHAQPEEGATAYMGTEGYTGPEVERNCDPHSRKSDAYGVGKTILKAYNGAFGGSPTEYDQVPRIAQLLALESPDRRITLKDALDQLKSTSAKVTNVLPQQAAQVSPDTAETKRRECRASDD